MRGTALPPAAVTLAKPSQYIVSDTSLEIFREIRQATKKKIRGARRAGRTLQIWYLSNAAAEVLVICDADDRAIRS